MNGGGLEDDDTNSLFEEWDENFLDEVIHVSEQAAATSANYNHHHQQPPPPPPPQSHSPPRVLSQSTITTTGSRLHHEPPSALFPKDVSPHSTHVLSKQDGLDDRLKRELSRATKLPTNREQGGLRIRNGDKKKEPLKVASSLTESKDADFQPIFQKNLEHQTHMKLPSLEEQPTYCLNVARTSCLQAKEAILEIPRPPDLSRITSGSQSYCSNVQIGSGITVVTPSCKSIGVQTDKPETPSPLPLKNDVSACQHLGNKLLAVWDMPSRRESQRNLVSELLLACEADLGILFGCLSVDSKAAMTSLADQRSSGVSLQNQKPYAQSAEAEKVYNLYSMMTKIGTGMVKLDSLLEALVDLCHLDNDVILYRSLRILHKTLNHTLCVDARSPIRDNVLVEELHSGINGAGTLGIARDNFSYSSRTTFKMRLIGLEDIYEKESSIHQYTLPACVNWTSIFELMHRIAMKNKEECIRLEAVAIMNMIVIRSKAYTDRDRFGRILGFKSVSELLIDSGLGVRKQAVHLLSLLLNCPLLMVMFCSGCKEELENAGAVNYDAKYGPSVKEFGAILEGLAGCISCEGTGVLELKLRRKTVILLGFLVSSGKLGFEIFLAYRLQKRTNFLVAISQMLLSEMDAEVIKYLQPSELSRERALLIREALILLNRLVSNPQYSGPVLRTLTDSRDIACLTVDIANRLSCEAKWYKLSDSMARQMKESEVFELARVFKKRIFTYLGNGLS